MTHDFYRIPPDRVPELQACFVQAHIPDHQLRWSASPCQGYQRCQVFWLTEEQHTALTHLTHQEPHDD